MLLQLRSHAEQTAAYLRSELEAGRWRNLLPGVHNLSKVLGVNHNTIHAALQLLEDEGLLSGQGRGRPRRITLPPEVKKTRSLRVKILCYERLDRGQAYSTELLARLQADGFAADFASKSLQDLGHNAKSVARYVEKRPADAWVIIAGNREILKWFAASPIPAFALFGRHTGLPIASSSPLKGPALVSVVERLVEMGHRRIVMMTRKERRYPRPGPLEQKFLDSLEARDFTVGKYNLPDWEEHPAGLHACLKTLFEHTPPTAIIISEPAVYVATDRFLSQHGIRVPEKVSLICCDFDPVFKWFDPEVSHIKWNLPPVVSRVVRWATNIAQGKEDHRQATYKAKWVKGGTTGPVAKS
ncbi:MAG: substrate-binding domain-containing protein [Verrucomicrobiae bacterium]|nr:substrate-binding domain-containing protein [Verrucomicrobiae bacterium]NNJ87545.1 substrate-binding domain-containing protein [Akkermansiaceae bacterium]